MIETSAVTLGEYGTAFRFLDALRAGRIAIEDATCPAVLAALQAGQKGIPFMPLRGIIGSDLLERRRDCDNTGFAFECPAGVPQTAARDAATLLLIRGRIAREIGETYPRFVRAVFPEAA